MAEAAETREVAEADRAGWALPAWVYRDEDFLALERERVFMPSWQIVCHLSDIAEAGDHVTFELPGALALVVRAHGRAEFRYIEMLITAAIIYWIISIVFEIIQARIEAYYGKGVAG